MEKLLHKMHVNNIEVYKFSDLKICDKLGEGANGKVYRSYICNKRCAAKKLSQDHINSNIDYKYFLNEILYEIKIGKKFNSKRIMKIYGFSYDKENNEVYIILELLNNKGCLFDYLYKMNNYLNKLDKITLFLSIVKAVGDMHDKKYCHCDLKPENLVYYYDMKEKTKYVKLIDLNCVTKIPVRKKYKNLNYTCGTYGYCAPEQHGNDKYVCLKSDIYSLGVIFLELLNKYELWNPKYYNYQKYRKSILNKLDGIKDEDLNIHRIIKKCLSKSPEKRYDINELYNEIIILKNNHNSHNFHNDHK